MQCDFCSEPNPKWDYPAHSIEMPDLPPDIRALSVQHWAACDACSALIEAGDRAGLAKRSDETFAKKYPWLPPLERGDAMTGVQAKFFESRFGGRRPITEAMLAQAEADLARLREEQGWTPEDFMRALEALLEAN